MSQFFRKGGIALNDTEWIQDFADKRLQYGVSQTKLAVMAGISREHLSRIESGKVIATEEMKVKLSGQICLRIHLYRFISPQMMAV
jgi:phage replication initiation protein